MNKIIYLFILFFSLLSTHSVAKENIMILQYNTGNWPLEVITGNSQKMKSLVIKHAYSRGFNTKAPVNDNPGSIIVF